jgi:hypothetical protein
MKNIFNTFCFLFTVGLHAQNLSFTQKIVYHKATDPYDRDLDSISVSYKNITKELNIQYLFISIAYNKKKECYLTLVDCGEALKGSFVNADGTPILFKSQAAIYNYLYQNSWEHQQTIQDTETKALWAQIFFNVNVVHTDQTHLFKRKL